MHSAAPVDRVWTEDEQWWDPVTVITSIQKQSGTLHQEGVCTATTASRLASWCHDAMVQVSQKRVCIRFRYSVVPPLFGSETRATSSSSTAVPSVRDEDGVVGMHDGHVDVLVEAPSSSITRSTHTTTTTTTAATHITAAAASVGRVELHHVAGIRGLPCFPLRPLHRRPMKAEKKRTAHHRPVSANEGGASVADGSSSSSCLTREGLVARPNSKYNNDTMGAGADSEQQSQLHMMDVCVGTRVFVTAFELSTSSITTPFRSSGSSSSAAIPPVVDELLQHKGDEEADEWVVFRHRYYVVATDTFAVIVPCVLLLIPWPSASASSSSSSSPKRCFLSNMLLAAYSPDIQRNIGPIVDAFAASMQQALRTPEKRREWFLLIVNQSWTFQGSVVTPTFLSYQQQQQQQQQEQQCQGDANQYPPINPNPNIFLTPERTVRPFVWSCCVTRSPLCPQDRTSDAHQTNKKKNNKESPTQRSEQTFGMHPQDAQELLHDRFGFAQVCEVRTLTMTKCEEQQKVGESHPETEGGNAEQDHQRTCPRHTTERAEPPEVQDENDEVTSLSLFDLRSEFTSYVARIVPQAGAVEADTNARTESFVSPSSSPPLFNVAKRATIFWATTSHDDANRIVFMWKLPCFEEALEASAQRFILLGYTGACLEEMLRATVRHFVSALHRRNRKHNSCDTKSHSLDSNVAHATQKEEEQPPQGCPLFLTAMSLPSDFDLPQWRDICEQIVAPRWLRTRLPFLVGFSSWLSSSGVSTWKDATASRAAGCRDDGQQGVEVVFRTHSERQTLRDHWATLQETYLLLHCHPDTPALRDGPKQCSDRIEKTDLHGIRCDDDQQPSPTTSLLVNTQRDNNAMSANYRSGGPSAVGVMLFGPPGSGKSTFARALQALLERGLSNLSIAMEAAQQNEKAKAEEEHSGEQLGNSSLFSHLLPAQQTTPQKKLEEVERPIGVHWVNQDEAGNRRRFLDTIENIVSQTGSSSTSSRNSSAALPHRRPRTSPSHSTSSDGCSFSPSSSCSSSFSSRFPKNFIIVDKCNVESQNRQDYAEVRLPIAVTFQMAHPYGLSALRDMCIERIGNRGDAHRTLTPSTFLSSSHQQSQARGGGSGGGGKDPMHEVARIVSNFIKPLPRYLSEGDQSDALGVVTAIDVTQCTEEQLEVAWRTLRLWVEPRLPPFEAVRDVVEDCCALSARYERSLLAGKKRK